MDALLDTVAGHQTFLGPLIPFLSAALQYLFPPFPDDTVTLFGAFLVTARDWSLALVLVTVTLGSLCGAAFDHWLGTWLARRAAGWGRGGIWSHIVPDPARLEQLKARFARHGAAYICLNRFVPGLRAFFFVAAGMAGMRRSVALFWGGVSALAWNALIVLAGMALGASFEELERLVARYSLGVWILLAALILLLVLRRLWTGRRGPSHPPEDS